MTDSIELITAKDRRLSLQDHVNVLELMLRKCADRNGRMMAALEECEEYFDNRADADCEGDPPRFVGNPEMRLLQTVRDAMRSVR